MQSKGGASKSINEGDNKQYSLTFVMREWHAHGGWGVLWWWWPCPCCCCLPVVFSLSVLCPAVVLSFISIRLSETRLVIIVTLILFTLVFIYIALSLITEKKLYPSLFPHSQLSPLLSFVVGVACHHRACAITPVVLSCIVVVILK
jgi:hypothetical protein